MNSTLSDPAKRIAYEMSRGYFAYWPEEIEAKWRAESPPTPAIPEIRDRQSAIISVQVRPCSYDLRGGDFASWDRMMECGRSYLVGSDVPMDDFIRQHRSSLTAWQKEAYAWAIENRFYRLLIQTPGKSWDVYARGEYVEIALPHHDAGGERNYISRDGKTKILVNVD